mgnify:CR=1 FL=1
MNEIEELKQELENIKEFIEKADVPSYVISLYNIAAKAVELAYNVHIKNDLNWRSFYARSLPYKERAWWSDWSY